MSIYHEYQWILQAGEGTRAPLSDSNANADCAFDSTPRMSTSAAGESTKAAIVLAKHECFQIVLPPCGPPDACPCSSSLPWQTASNVFKNPGFHFCETVFVQRLKSGVSSVLGLLQMRIKALNRIHVSMSKMRVLHVGELNALWMCS